MKLNRNVGFFLVIALAASLLAFKLVGCAAPDDQVAQVEGYRDQVNGAVDQLRAATTQISAKVQQLQPGDPVRKALEDKLAGLTTQLEKYQALEPKIDAALKAMKDPSSIKAEDLSSIPVVGPYAGLVVLGIGLFRQWSQKNAEQKKAEELAAAIHNVVPAPNESQKLAVNEPLSPETQDFLASLAPKK